MVEKIGLAATMDMSGFDKGMAAYTKGLDQMTGQTQKSAGFLQNAFSTAMGVFSGQAILGAAKSVVNGLKDMAQTAATIPAIAGQFDRLGGSIEEMRKGSAGLIDDTELMKNFNKAASLVSVDFAKKLPNAMSLLGRAAAASGQDVNYMLESLVTGVGRVSPMILDNLGIQVSLTEATEAYAAKLGKSTKELSKQEQQTAVMNVVMAKLEAAYGGMDDVSQSAQAQMAAFAVQMKNFRDQIGVAVLPIMTSFMGGLSQLAARIIPSLVSGIQAATPVIKSIADSITLAFNMISDVIGGTGGDIPWEDMLPPWLADIAYMVSDAFANLQPTIQQIIGVVEGGLAWDKLLPPEVVGTIKTMGATFKSLATMIAAALKQIAPIIQQVLIKHIQTVGAIFKSVFPEIQKTVQATMANFQAIVKQAIPVVVKLFETLGPAITKAMDIIRNIIQTVVPFVANLIRERVAFMTQQFGVILKWVQQNMPLIQRTIETVLRAIQTVWNAVWPVLSHVVLVAFDAVKVVVSTAINAVLGIIKTVMLVINGEWEQAWEALKGVLSTVWEGIQKLLLTLIGGLVTAITGKKGDFLKVGQDFINELWNGAVAKWDLFKADMVAKFATIKDWVVGLYNVGIDMIQGLWDGVVDKWNDFKQDLIDKFNALPEWVRNILGEASPSKVFIEIGEGIGEGFALGIEASSDDVLKAVVNMADKVVALVQGMVEALSAMEKAPVTTNLQAWADAIAQALQVVINALTSLYDVAGGPKANQIDLARRLSATFDTVVGFVQDAADALASLNTVDVLAVTKEKVQGFMDAVTIILEAIKEATGIWSAGLTGTKGEKTIDETFAPARKFVEQIAAMLSVVELAVTSINDMATLNLAKDIKDKARDFAKGLNTLLVEIFKATEIWTHKTPEEMGAAASFAQSAQQMLSVVTVAVEAITSLFDFTPARDLPNKAKIFAAGLNYVLVEIHKASLIWKDTGLEAAALFAANAEQVIAIISSAIEAISQLGTFTAVTDMRAKARAFAANIVALMDELDKALIALVLPSRGAPTVPLTAEEISERFAALGAFAAAVQDGIGFITPTLEAFEQLAVFAPTERLGQIAGEFMRQAIALMINLEDILAAELMPASGARLTGILTPEEVAERFTRLAEFSTAVQAGIGFIAPTLEAFASMEKFTPTEGIGFRAGEFIRQAIALMVNLEDTLTAELMPASGVNLGGIPLTPEEITKRFERLAAFSEAIQKGIGFIKPAIEAMLALGEYKAIKDLAAKAKALVADINVAINELLALVNSWVWAVEDGFEAEALDALGAFSTSVQAAISFIKPAIEAIAALAEYAAAEDFDEAIAAFKLDLGQVIDALGELAANPNLSADRLEALAEFSSMLNDVIGQLQRGVEALEAIAEYEAGSAVKAFKNLTEDINRAVNYLWNATAVLEGDMGVARAGKFESAAIAIHDKIMNALEKLGILGDGSSALSGTTTFSVVMASALNTAKTAIVDFRDTWVPAWVDITNAIRSATQALITFGEKAAETKPPEWAEGHSPPPLAKWMDAIADATRRAKEQFSGFGGGLSPYSTGAPAYATAPVSSSTSVAVNFGDVNITSGMDMALFEARVRRTVKEAIKG